MKKVKTQLTDTNQGRYTMTIIEGKAAIIFDTVPAVLLISGDGVCSTTDLFIHGTHKPEISKFEITGDVKQDEEVIIKLEQSAVLKPRGDI